MIVKIIMEGVLLGALLALLCAVGIRKGAVTMVFPELGHGGLAGEHPARFVEEVTAAWQKSLGQGEI